MMGTLFLCPFKHIHGWAETGLWLLFYYLGTIPEIIKDRRRNAPIDDNGVLKEDMLFTSPSYAAMFVIGKSENGLTRWKTSDGKTLKALEAEQEAN